MSQSKIKEARRKEREEAKKRISGVPLNLMTPSGQVDYFTQDDWTGKVYHDDKYFDDHQLEDHFIIFYTYAFSHLNLPRPTKAQYEMALFLNDKTNPHRLVMAERGLAKSLTSQIYVVWRLLNDPDEHILVMSAGMTRAGNYSQFVQKLIKIMPITKPLSPRQNIERTSSVSFDVAGSTASDSPSVYAVGASSQVTGFRASLIVYDDIETAQTVESAVKTEAIDTYAMEAQNLLMSGKDESITLCTPHSMSSIYIKWIDEKGFTPFVIPALYPENDSPYFGGLAPYIKDRIANNPEYIGTAVDERLNYNFLMSKKMRVGASKFKLQYMIDVSDSDDMRYPLKLSDFIVTNIDDDQASLKIGYSSMPENRISQKHNGFAKDKLYSPMYMSQEMASYDFKVLSVDTAGRGKDEIGISIIYHLNSKLFIKKITGLQGGFEDEIMENIANLCAMHNINTCVVEDNFGDGMFTKLLDPHIRRISPLTEIEGIKVSGQKEVRIIEALEPMLNQHRLVIDLEIFNHDLTAKNRDYSFTHQLSHITRERDSLRHDDRLDSLTNGIVYMIEWMSDDEEAGMAYHQEKEAKKTLEFTLQHFSGRSRQNSYLNYASGF
jgi:hypothetical protein